LSEGTPRPSGARRAVACRYGAGRRIVTLEWQGERMLRSASGSAGRRTCCFVLTAGHRAPFQRRARPFPHPPLGRGPSMYPARLDGRARGGCLGRWLLPLAVAVLTGCYPTAGALRPVPCGKQCFAPGIRPLWRGWLCEFLARRASAWRWCFLMRFTCCASRSRSPAIGAAAGAAMRALAKAMANSRVAKVPTISRLGWSMTRQPSSRCLRTNARSRPW